ncbi:MAG: hypothetical protein EA381_00065 [Planctomycetaceae bacterium]|nr:MAG: hypothetical protein EA381_00065 [Planctomycetaceae bacterium]
MITKDARHPVPESLLTADRPATPDPDDPFRAGGANLQPRPNAPQPGPEPIGQLRLDPAERRRIKDGSAEPDVPLRPKVFERPGATSQISPN